MVSLYLLNLLPWNKGGTFNFFIGVEVPPGAVDEIDIDGLTFYLDYYEGSY